MSQPRAGTLCKGTDSSRLCKPSVSKAVWLEIQALGSAQCRHNPGEHLQMELQEQQQQHPLPAEPRVVAEAGSQAGLERDTETLTWPQILSQEGGGSPGREKVVLRGISGALQLVS